MLRRHAIAFFIFFTPCLSIAENIFTCPDIIRASSLPTSELQVGDIAVDYNMGLIQVMGYDANTDIGKVFIFDESYAKKTFRDRALREQLASLAIFIPHFSNRRIAKIGTADSAKIIRSRIADFFGIDYITVYFGLYPVIQRLRPKSSFIFKDDYAQIIQQNYPEHSGENLDKTLEFFRKIVFRRTETEKPDDLKRLYTLILELSSVTGENLIHTGLLTTFARPQFNNWVWPLHGGPYSFSSPTWGLTNVRLGVPRDIDHYARSWIWRDTQKLQSDDEFEVVKNVDQAVNSIKPDEKVFWVRNGFSHRKPDSSRVYTNMFMRRTRQISPFFLNYAQSDPFWLRIFEVAKSSDLKPRYVKGQRVRFILPDSDIFRAQRLAQEIQRVSYDGGAQQVEVVIVQEP